MSETPPNTSQQNAENPQFLNETPAKAAEKIHTVFVNDFNLIPDENLNEELKRMNMEWNSANGFCLNDKGEVAIVYEKEKGYWTLPGGRKEGTETPEQTFTREVREETQGEIEKLKYFHCVYGKAYTANNTEVPHPSNKVCFRYICKLKNVQEFISNQDGFEIEQRKFVTLGELPNYISWLKDTPSGRETIEKLTELLGSF